MLAQDPTIEPAHQLLMRVLAETGRTGEALRQFGECTGALRARLDVAPDEGDVRLRRPRSSAVKCGRRARQIAEPPITKRRRLLRRPRLRCIVRRLLGGDPSRPLYGRAEELEAVRRFVAEGHGVLLLVGEAGLGKTRLASECARVARRSGATVLVGHRPRSRTTRVCRMRPFADAWAHHRRTTGASPDERSLRARSRPRAAPRRKIGCGSSSPSSARWETSAAGAPSASSIEDLHQADPSSLHLFHHLARATRSLPLLLVGTLRDDEVQVGRALHTLLGNLGRERLGTRIVLRRIDQEATGHLVADLLDGSGRAADDEVVAAVHALAEGNPFHTEEVVQAMRDEGTSHPTPPENLLDTVRQRVRRLGRDAERLLSAAALYGLRFPFDVAQAAAGLTPELALEALELGIEARIVEEDGW